MRKIILAVLLTSLFFGGVGPVLAADPVIPEFNSLCWEKEACVEARIKLDDNLKTDQKKAEAGWLGNEAPCVGEKWGRCLPVGQTKTSISFGGKKEFADIGVFILTIYNYAVGVAGIVAVIVIILSGGQWVASGGNSEMISSAKKRIGGAVIGLLIAYFSYVILNTINPALVNLRLPQIWMVRSQKITPEYCFEASATGTLFALAAPVGQKVASDALQKAQFDITATNTAKFTCGNKLFVKGAGKDTCTATNCASGQLCVPDMSKSDSFKCQPGDIAVFTSQIVSFDTSAISNCTLPIEGWETPAVDYPNQTKVYAVCSVRVGLGFVKDITESVKSHSMSANKRSQAILLSVNSGAAISFFNSCVGNNGEMKGLVIKIGLDEICGIDEWHAIGKNGVDLMKLESGEDDNDPFFSSNKALSQLDSDYFIPFTHVVPLTRNSADKKPVLISVQVESVYDIDEGTIPDSEDFKVYDKYK